MKDEISWLEYKHNVLNPSHALSEALRKNEPYIRRLCEHGPAVFLFHSSTDEEIAITVSIEKGKGRITGKSAERIVVDDEFSEKTKESIKHQIEEFSKTQRLVILPPLALFAT